MCMKKMSKFYDEILLQLYKKHDIHNMNFVKINYFLKFIPQKINLKEKKCYRLPKVCL